MSKINKNEQIIIRMTAEEKNLLKKLAKNADLDLSKYVRQTLFPNFDEVIEDVDNSTKDAVQ